MTCARAREWVCVCIEFHENIILVDIKQQYNTACSSRTFFLPQFIKNKKICYDKLIPSHREMCMQNWPQKQYQQRWTRSNAVRMILKKKWLGLEYYAYTQALAPVLYRHFRAFLFMHMFTKMSSIANIIIYFNFCMTTIIRNYVSLIYKYASWGGSVVFLSLLP